MHARNYAHPLLADADFERLKQRLIELTGLHYYQNKDTDFCFHLEKRFAACGVRTCSEYLVVLSASAQGGAELDELIGELTIGETYFFRHREQFDALREHVIPAIIAAKQDGFGSKNLRIWSAGCSIGAEPYTVAMLLRDHFQAALQGWRVSIWATDINRAFLRRASAGLFDDWAFRGNAPDLRHRHFSPVGKQWLINPDLRAEITFEHENLAHPGGGAPWPRNEEFDLIICRNVMIYFDANTLAKLIPLFHQSLQSHGWLMVGHAEQGIENHAPFEVHSFPGATLLKRVSGRVDSPFEFSRIKPVEWELRRPMVDAPLAPRAADPAEALSRVKRLADSGEFTAALSACSDLFRGGMKHAPLYFYQGLILIQKTRWKEAESALRECVALDPNFALAHYYHGLARRELGNDAVDSFQRAYDLADSMPSTTVLEHGDGLSARELKHLAKREMGAE